MERNRITLAFVGIASVVLFADLAIVLAFRGTVRIFHPFNLVSYGIAALFSSVIAGAGILLVRSDIPVDRHRRVLVWCLAGGVGFVAFNGPLLATTPGQTLEGVARFAHYTFGIGAVGGAVGGFIEARSLERARVAERTEVRAERAEAEAERFEFLNSFLRHEVLNNIAIIRGHADLALENESALDEALYDHLATIQRTSEESAEIVTNVRHLLEALQPAEAFEAFDLATVLTDELENLQDTYDTVEVDAAIPESVPVRADPLVARLFWNLLSNAVEHNDGETPTVTVRVTQTTETVTVRIADDGPGFPESDRGTLFEQSGGPADHGIGLYLVGTLVERYDGRIELTETGPDGSCFTVELPRAGTTGSELVVTAADGAPVVEPPADGGPTADVSGP